ncbi:hypothetical protein [Streptococcus merionis]|nr:hypothetical protein [Streptococcus merionis]
MLIRKIEERLVHKIIDDLYTFGNHSLNYTKQVRTTLSIYAVEKKYIVTNPVLTVKITPKKAEEELKPKAKGVRQKS